MLVDGDSPGGIYILWLIINVCLVAIAASLVCFLEAKVSQNFSLRGFFEICTPFFTHMTSVFRLGGVASLRLNVI